MSTRARWDVAVVGASTLVGEALLELLRSGEMPIDRVHALDDLRDLGRTAGDERDEPSLDVAGFDFSRVGLAFFCGRAQVSRQLAPLAAGHTLAIDASSAFRDSGEVPLVAADVNPQVLDTLPAAAQGRPVGLVALPSTAVVALATVLAPLHAAARLLRADVASYHSVSGAGRSAIDELARESAALLSGQEPRVRAGTARLAFNVVPQVDALTESGESLEEHRLAAETRRLLGEPSLALNATAVRVPVFHGHALAVHAHFERDLTPQQAGDLLQAAPGVLWIPPQARPPYPTPATAVAPGDRVQVGRIRRDATRPASLNLWITADNIKKCAAINAFQVGRILVNRYC